MNELIYIIFMHPTVAANFLAGPVRPQHLPRVFSRRVFGEASPAFYPVVIDNVLRTPL